MAIGVHVMGGLYGCPKELLEKVEIVMKLLNETVKEAEFNFLKESYHQFEPAGVTGVILLRESHISVHTWPERNFAAVDIFTCGKEGNAERGFEILCKKLNPEKIEKQIVKR